MDNLETNIRFKDAHHLQFELLSDTTGKTVKAYDTKVPFVKLSKRITYLLDQEHVIKASYEEFFAGDKHVKEMIKALGTKGLS
jgi:thioredoxin-dependent peroxiredoxin